MDNEHFFGLQQMLKMSSTSLNVRCQPLSKTRDSFVLRKIFPYFLQCDCTWLRMKLSKKTLCVAPRTRYLQSVQIWSYVAIVITKLT